MADLDQDSSIDRALHKRTLELMDFLYCRPDIESLTQYLATNICPSGEICRVHIASLHNDGNFRTFAHFGYSTGSPVDGWTIPITEDRPVVDAFRNNKQVISNSDEIISRYRDFVNIDPASPWGSSVMIPTKHPLIFGFRRQPSILPRERPLLTSYFEIIGKVLDFWQPQERRDVDGLNTLFLKSSRRSIESGQSILLGEPLTERQKQIVALMVEGQTNFQIAQRISFSESLVRQETVVIYAKLGVSGRRDLIKSPESFVSDLRLA